MDNNLDISSITSLDELFALTQVTGSIERAATNALYGLDHQNLDSAIPENRDAYGYTFFTRPMLNLTNSNLRNVRRLYDYLTTQPLSIQRYVRCMLDPRLHYAGITTPLVDPQMAYIPVLSNMVKTISGWPDIVLPTFTSKAGVRREEWSIGDGSIDIYEKFSLDCTFRNFKDEPITNMLILWLTYIAAVFEGKMSPHISMIIENEIDYNTRIYRIVTDESKRFVKKIAATGASFPVNDPTGRMFDFNKSVKYNDQTRDINVRFECNGALYNDPILVVEFNKTTGIFNRKIAAMMEGQPTSLEKIPEELKVAFKNRGYPYINPNTLELEWYIDTSSQTYRYVMNNLNKG